MRLPGTLQALGPAMLLCQHDSAYQGDAAASGRPSLPTLETGLARFVGPDSFRVRRHSGTIRFLFGRDPFAGDN